MYDLTFADGSMLEGLSKTGGGNWFSEEPIDETILSEENLAEVTVSGDEDAVLRNQRCDFVDQYEGGYSFNLRNRTETEALQEENARLSADNEMLIECILEMSEIIYGE